MAALMRERGVALRPHAKTHKSLAFARRQLAAGAVGLTVATIGEAEVFADGGVEDLFIAYPVIAHGPKAERLRRLAGPLQARRSASTRSTGIEGARERVRRPDGDGVGARGRDRGRCRRRADRACDPTDVLALAQAAEARGLAVGGVFTHGGHGYGGRAERVAAAEDEVDGLTAAAERLRASGIESASSAPDRPRRPSCRRAARSRRSGPGTYIFGDRQQAFLADQALDDTALLVAATVVSHGSGGGFVVDAGAKILAKDVAPYLPGHGTDRRLPGGRHRAGQRPSRGRRAAGRGRAGRPSATWSGSHPTTSVRSSTSSTSTWSPRAAGSSGAGRWMPVDATPETGTQPGPPRDARPVRSVGRPPIRRGAVAGHDAGALAAAITRAWRPYRWRGYVLGLVVGILAGGILGPLVTVSLAFALGLAGVTIDPLTPWAEIVWSGVFAVTFAAAGAWAVARWLPRDFKAATETYLWLAVRAEAHWHELFGDRRRPTVEVGDAGVRRSDTGDARDGRRALRHLDGARRPGLRAARDRADAGGHGLGPPRAGERGLAGRSGRRVRRATLRRSGRRRPSSTTRASDSRPRWRSR